VFLNPKAADVPLFVLTQTVDDAWKIVQHCPGVVKAVNIANVGKFDGVPMNEKTAMLDGFFSQKEIEACKELIRVEGLQVYHQITPEKSQESVEKALRDKKLL
jgi:mannose/fructose/N-acetylgalactosamine-specific phosphotransferase system component IIB